MLITIFALLAVDCTDLPTFTNGQIGHLLHLVMPGIVLFGLEGTGGGTLLLIIVSLIFLGLLYATRGGWGKVSFKYGSLVIVLQCLFIIPDIDGSLGS